MDGIHEGHTTGKEAQVRELPALQVKFTIYYNSIEMLP